MGLVGKPAGAGQAGPVQAAAGGGRAGLQQRRFKPLHKTIFRISSGVKLRIHRLAGSLYFFQRWHVTPPM
jgi:hypothetical protein